MSRVTFLIFLFLFLFFMSFIFLCLMFLLFVFICLIILSFNSFCRLTPQRLQCHYPTYTLRSFLIIDIIVKIIFLCFSSSTVIDVLSLILFLFRFIVFLISSHGLIIAFLLILLSLLQKLNDFLPIFGLLIH